MLPLKAISIPKILLEDVFVLKSNAPVIITNMGVKELRVPAKALSIPSSATQNKKAGNKLPKTPDIKISINLFRGIDLKCLIADGNSTIPEKTIRRAATWYADNCNKPSFIMMKLLPHIMERMMKINQLRNPLFKF